MKEVSVAIIGCGPAGMFAAEACRQQGITPRILAPRKSMSTIGGAQYLHKEIPGLTGKADGLIHYRKLGTRDGYANKVYGNLKMQVSWDTFDEGARPFWSLQSAYALAWLRSSETIREISVIPGHLRALINSYDLVINTAPKKMLCLQPDRHTFTSQRVYLTVPEKRVDLRAENQIVYNGQPRVRWYRWSFINGLGSYEFSFDPGYTKKQVIEIHKPLNNFCDCHESDKYLEVGRYGRWQKGALTHEAYFLTMEALDAL